MQAVRNLLADARPSHLSHTPTPYALTPFPFAHTLVRPLPAHLHQPCAASSCKQTRCLRSLPAHTHPLHLAHTPIAALAVPVARTLAQGRPSRTHPPHALTPIASIVHPRLWRTQNPIAHGLSSRMPIVPVAHVCPLHPSAPTLIAPTLVASTHAYLRTHPTSRAAYLPTLSNAHCPLLSRPALRACALRTPPTH
ncbi:hypothetical protein K438DRAFT_1980594 [Mycena galopus ATCC 62051]|nr:hypothetical protein K438DRAFT_1980594 [Mycena galopus ATCC 62051]